MSKLYIITGPAGVGKSTISKGIAEKIEKSVLLEGDDFYHQVIGSYVPAWKEKNHLDIFWKVCIDVIKDYLEAGYDVIFNYIIPKETADKLKEIFSTYDMKLVVLMTSEETILKRDKQRPEDCQMKDRCIILLNEFKKYNYDDNNILNTDKLSIEESIDTIIKNNKFKYKEK